MEILYGTKAKIKYARKLFNVFHTNLCNTEASNVAVEEQTPAKFQSSS